MINKIKKIIFEDLEPHFHKGGKYEKYYTLFDGFATFLFTPGKTTENGVHIKDGVDLKRTMVTVIVAMLPALIFGIYNVGHQHFISNGEYLGFFAGALDKVLFGLVKVLPIVVVSYGTGLAIEFLFASMKRHQIEEGFLVSGMLIPLVMPPDIPLWMVAVATAFAVILGKEVFGGTGMNILNVALTARVFVFFAYPSFISGDKVWIAEKADAYSGATPLAEAASGNPFSWGLSDFILGTIPGSIGETSFIAIAIGAAILIFTGIGSWRIMLSVLAGGFVMGLLLNLVAVNYFMEIPAYYHLFIGSLAFGAVYMATDPVTAAQTNKGKLIYGFGIGLFAVLIRVLNPAYPEGVMLAILFFNVFAPLIDNYVVGANIKKRLARVKK